jgi:hypothetical protein
VGGRYEPRFGAQGIAGLTESESVGLAIMLAGASIVVLSWSVGAAGFSIHPIGILVASIAGTAAAWRAALRGLPVEWCGRRLFGFLLVVLGFLSYLCWLAWPSFLPISEGPDLVHHLSLIHFIQHQHALLHDRSLGAYLGEMDGYTPGSHLLAALVGDWLRTDALRVVHPLTAFAVAVKAGVVYNVILRMLPAGRQQAAPAVAGTLLLLVPHAYLLRSFTYFHFYAQVIAETFAVAMVWTIVVWHQQQLRRWLALFALLGVVVALSWPVWLPAPALALAIVVLAERARPLSQRAVDLAVVGIPIAIVTLVYTLTHAGSAGILRSGGSTLVPSVGIFGWPFLVLTICGVGLSIRRRDRVAPVLVFATACVVQIGGLLAVQVAMRASNPYLAHKTVHLLVYAMVVCAALALEQGWRVVEHWLPVVRGRAGWILPVLVVAWLARRDLPTRPLTSPITEPVYQAGHWAKVHVRSGCIDYLVEHWLTAYWLHVDVLGNPRQSERMRSEGFGYRQTVGRWIAQGSLPYAIAGDVDRLPNDLRRNMRVLERFGPAAVIERIDGRGQCTDTTPAIDDIARLGFTGR